MKKTRFSEEQMVKILRELRGRPQSATHIRCQASGYAVSLRRGWRWRNRVPKHKFVRLRAAHGVRPFQSGERGCL
jgi:hypothetical protein